MKRGRRDPSAPAHRANPHRVVPQRAAVRARVPRRLGAGAAVHLVRDLRVVGPRDVFPHQFVLFAAVGARHQIDALIRCLVCLLNAREAVDGRRAAENHLAAAVRVALVPLFEQRDRVALLAHVLVRVVRFLDRDYGRGRRLDVVRRVRRDELEEAARERLVIPQVVLVAARMHGQLRRQARRHLDHRLELLHVELLRRLLFREHDDHRARVDVDPPADVVQQHPIRPRDLRRLHAHDLLHGRIVERRVHAEHPRRDVRVIAAGARRCLRAHPAVLPRPLRRPDPFRRAQ
ncbi:Uncharacterised protein [Burkholderia pseudomallei]|nr:Uncharacterised protein [Burkholderia pseudomallei]CAJ7901814.1 Uncharacterised protein [Burkholderia pseudomallei]